METNNGRQTVCQACGTTFGCCADRIETCWCSTVQVSDEAREEIKKKFSDCICPACLAKFAQKEATPKA
jgi:hypothetical protein